ncbi:MAG: hypothetical protein LBD88_01385 [Candidatus Peribacteria bacterium]|jgi:hypothetical protein|nr:hypothetical protein [Candidatus Peribacteria bacterium]
MSEDCGIERMSEDEGGRYQKILGDCGGERMSEDEGGRYQKMSKNCGIEGMSESTLCHSEVVSESLI